MAFKLLCQVFLLFVVFKENDLKKLPDVTVYKCCEVNEMLQGDINNFMCMPLVENWVPLVYARKKNEFLPPGKVPPHWRLEYNKNPECAPGYNMSLLELSVQSSNIMLANGSFHAVSEKMAVPPTQFCIDKTLALVCTKSVNAATLLQQRRVRVQKCCGDNGVYDDKKATCVVARSTSDNTFDVEWHDDNSSVELVEGWPNCGQRDLVISGKLHDARVLSDGALSTKSAAKVIPSDMYCLEHVIGQDMQTASAIMCLDYMTAANSIDWRFTLYPLSLFFKKKKKKKRAASL